MDDVLGQAPSTVVVTLENNKARPTESLESLPMKWTRKIIFNRFKTRTPQLQYMKQWKTNLGFILLELYTKAVESRYFYRNNQSSEVQFAKSPKKET